MTDGFAVVNPQLNKAIDRFMGPTAGVVPNNYDVFRSQGRGVNLYPVYQSATGQFNSEFTGSRLSPYGDFGANPEQFQERGQLVRPTPAAADPVLGLRPPEPAKGFEFQSGAMLFAPSNTAAIDQRMAQMASPPQNTQPMQVSQAESVGTSFSVGLPGSGTQRDVPRPES